MGINDLIATILFYGVVSVLVIAALVNGYREVKQFRTKDMKDFEAQHSKAKSKAISHANRRSSEAVDEEMDRRIVLAETPPTALNADDDALASGHPPDASDDPGGRRLAVVEAVRRERGELEERAARVEQRVDPLPRQQLAAVDVPLAGALASAERDPADAGDDPGGRRLAVVETVRGQRGQLEERAAGVEQRVDPLAGQQLAAVDVPLPGPLAPAERRLSQLLGEIGGERGVRRGVTVGLGRGGPGKRRCIHAARLTVVHTIGPVLSLPS